MIIINKKPQPFTISSAVMSNIHSQKFLFDVDSFHFYCIAFYWEGDDDDKYYFTDKTQHTNNSFVEMK